MTKIAEPLLFDDLAPQGPKATNDVGCADALSSRAMTSAAVTSWAVASAAVASAAVASAAVGSHGRREPRLAAPRHAVVRRIKTSSNGGSWGVSDAGFTQEFPVGSYLGFEARGLQAAPRGELYPSQPGRTHPKRTETHSASLAGAPRPCGPKTSGYLDLAAPAPQHRVAPQDSIHAVAGYVFAAALLACTFFV